VEPVAERIVGPEARVRIGIDVGQKVDPSAIAVVEVVPRIEGGEPVGHYEVRFLQRLPLGATYPANAARLGEVVANIEAALPWVTHAYRQKPRLDLEVYADATGVGQPLVDILNETGLGVVPTYFTHGDRRTVADGRITLGKAWLVSRLKSMFQTGRVHLPPSHPEAAAMARELEDYEIRVAEDANDRYGAFKVGAHDDLVTALGLAVQGDARPRVGPLDPVLVAAFVAGGLPPGRGW